LTGNAIHKIKNTHMEKKIGFISGALLTILLFAGCRGDRYEEVKIGHQVWMTQNLNVDIFRNGDTLFHAQSDEEWVKAGKEGKPAWCYYNNDPANGNTYGRLYNWYAVNDQRGMAPEGWKVATYKDWEKLLKYLGGKAACPKLRETGTKHWNSPNDRSTNQSGFTALPGGWRDTDGTFYAIGYWGEWWSATEYNTDSAFYFGLGNNEFWDMMFSYYAKEGGGAVRCVKE
jgi:uncharacterized protein (TIGR02145 family)